MAPHDEFYSHESYQLHDEPGFKVVKAGRLKCLGNILEHRKKVPAGK
jgi:hypothetical protein